MKGAMMLVFHTAGVPYRPAGKGSCLDPYFTKVSALCPVPSRRLPLLASPVRSPAAPRAPLALVLRCGCVCARRGAKRRAPAT